MFNTTTSWKTTNDSVNEAIEIVNFLIDAVDADIENNQANRRVGLLEIDFKRRKHLLAALENLSKSHK